MSVLDRFKLDGKRALVTGASRGLGLEMALALAEAGADVGITGRDEASLAEAATALRSRGRQVWTLRGDMSVPTECEALCEKALGEINADGQAQSFGGTLQTQNGQARTY